MFSLLFWVPLAYLFHAADHKQMEIHARQNLAFEGMATFMMMHTVGMLQAQAGGGAGEGVGEKDENELDLKYDKNVNDLLYREYGDEYGDQYSLDGEDMAGGIDLDERTIEPTNVNDFGIG